MLRKFVESSNLISKQITIEYPHCVCASVCVWDNLCVRPKVGNAILYELQTNTNKSQFGHANCTKFKKIYSQQGRQASPIMTIYTNYTVNLAQRLQEEGGREGGVAQTKYSWNC